MEGSLGMGIMTELDDAHARNLKEHAQLQHFEAQAFVDALQREINVSHERGFKHMRTDMNIEDATRLCSFIRRAILLGA